MEKIFEFFNSNPWLNIIFLLLAIIGIILTIYTFLKGKKNSKPTYEKQKMKIISSNLSKLKDLKIKYKKEPIEELSVSRFVIYNAGKKSIRRQDIAPKDKIRIKLTNGSILNYELKFITKDINNVNVSLSSNKDELNIDFDFLGYFDGLVIEFYHNVKEDDDIKLLGTIMDSGNFTPFFKQFYQFKYYLFLSKYAKKSEFLFFIVMIITLPICLILIPFMMYKLFELKRLMPNEFILSEKNWPQHRV